MCNFFSFVADSENNFYYFDHKQRQKILANQLKLPSRKQLVEGTDSHSEICAYYNLDVNHVKKCEYNFFTKKLDIDESDLILPKVSSIKAEIKTIDVQDICPQLIIKPIINPIEMERQKVTKKEKELLKKWASVRASVWASVEASVRDSVEASVRDSVEASVWDSVRASVEASVRDSVWDSVRASVEASVRDSVRASVWASVWAYTSSFFDIKYKYDFSSCVKLWESGFVPSFDGKTWRLHGYKGEVFYEMGSD